MLLIREEDFESAKVVQEATETGEKSTYISGVFIQSGVQNRNRRMYPKPIIERELDKYQTSMKSKRALGELGHPDNPTINLDRISHLVTELKYVNENDVVGKAKLLNTPCGSLALSLVNEGVQLGVSTRGLGSLKESNGVNIVQDDFSLRAIDIVSDPSAPDAFVQGILEGKEWVLLNGVLVEQDIERIMDKADELTTKGQSLAEAWSLLSMKIDESFFRKAMNSKQS